MAARESKRREAPEDGGGRVAFSISAELRRRCEAVIDAIRQAEDPSDHLDELAEVVVDMTDCGLDFYFLHPLERAGAGRVAKTTTRVGLAAARRGLPAVIRRVMASFTDEQVLEIADFIDEILLREPGPSR